MKFIPFWSILLVVIFAANLIIYTINPTLITATSLLLGTGALTYHLLSEQIRNLDMHTTELTATISENTRLNNRIHSVFTNLLTGDTHDHNEAQVEAPESNGTHSEAHRAQSQVL